MYTVWLEKEYSYIYNNKIGSTDLIKIVIMLEGQGVYKQMEPSN